MNDIFRAKEKNQYHKGKKAKSTTAIPATGRAWQMK